MTVPPRHRNVLTTGPSSRARLPERLVRLYLGLVAFGVSVGLMIRARLGLGPWDVLHQGLADRLDVDIGWVVIAVGVVALAGWIPLRERPGIGTVSNVVIVGLVVNLTVDVVASPRAMAARVGLLVGGIVLNGVATGLYIGARLGPGPRDGLMTGLARRGHSIRLVRGAIELSVLILGVLLGGQFGLGTIAYAVAIGPLAHWLLPRLDTASPPAAS